MASGHLGFKPLEAMHSLVVAFGIIASVSVFAAVTIEVPRGVEALETLTVAGLSPWESNRHTDNYKSQSIMLDL